MGTGALKQALFRRMEIQLRYSLDQLSEAELIDAVEAATPAETVARVLSAAPGIGGENGDEWTEEILRGAAAKQEMLRIAGPTLSSTEAARFLGLKSAAGVKARIPRKVVFAVQNASGEWVFPARQFRPEDGRVRKGLPRVLEAFGDEDPWVVLSVLVAPNPLTGEGVVLDELDDPEVTAAVVELARTYGDQGAS
jgi:hypothetical protein